MIRLRRATMVVLAASTAFAIALPFLPGSLASHQAAAQEAPRATPPRAICNNPPTSRYRIKGAEVHDTQTGLTWQRCSVGQGWVDGVGCAGKVKFMTWKDATQEATGGWRVPRLDELRTLVSPICTVPSINEVAFPDMDLKDLVYWASPIEGTVAWYVAFGEINPHCQDRAPCSPKHAVRLVREGQ